jgi:hypothetical protein
MFQPSLDVPALVFSLPLPLGNGNEIDSFEFKLQLASCLGKAS